MTHREKLVRAWRDWRRGLLCCLPPWLMRLADPIAAPYLLLLDESGNLKVAQQLGDEIQALGSFPLAAPASGSVPLKTLRGAGRWLVLRLPPTWALSKRSRFPAAAAENLRQVIGFEMDRLTPFPVSQVFYDYQVHEHDEDTGELIVDLMLVPRSRLDQVLEQLRGSHLRIACVDLPNAWPEMNLLPPEERPRISRGEALLNISVWLLVLTLLLGVLATPLYQQRQIALELERRANQAKRQAMVVTNLRNRVDQSRELLERVPTRREELPSTVLLINELTKLLPDDTWVQQLELKQGKLELRGLSRQATSLIQKLEDSPNLHNVSFRSPVLQAQGEERFHLAADLMAKGPNEPAGNPAGHPSDTAGSDPTAGLVASGL